MYSQQVKSSVPERPRSLFYTLAALTAAVAAAAALTIAIDHRPTESPAATLDLRNIPVVACAERAPAASSASAADSDPAVRQEKARALQMLEQSFPVPTGESFQFATYSDLQFEMGRTGDIKEINIDSRCGDVSVRHTERPGVLILAGKRTAAQSYERAREYAKQLNYKLSRDGDKVSVKISQPATSPQDAWGGVTCMVLAPKDVKVSTTSNSG